MSWSIGYDEKHRRDIGYGVPAECDHPDCKKEINRGLSYVCGGEPYGGEHGCGLYFCADHLTYNEDDIPLCDRCIEGKEHFDLKPDVAEWIEWKLTDESWQQWRDENPDEVEKMRRRITGACSVD